MSSDSDLETVLVWTDGSCLRNPGGPGGWAAIMRYGPVEHELVGGEPKTEVPACIVTIFAGDQYATAVRIFRTEK